MHCNKNETVISGYYNNRNKRLLCICTATGINLADSPNKRDLYYFTLSHCVTLGMQFNVYEVTINFICTCSVTGIQ